MNESKDRVKIKLQKTISNSISNVISSLCQQVVQYQSSIEIFGLLSFNIDGDFDVSVKLNETFVKKETNVNINNGNNDIEFEQMEMEIEPKESDCSLLIDESENLSLSFGNKNNKRRPRMPKHTFRHIAEGESNNNNSKESEKAKDNSPEADIELKIDTQFEYQTRNKSTRFESMNRSIETDETDDKIRDKSVDKISRSSSMINIENKIIDNDNIFSHLSTTSTNKPTQTYKCSIRSSEENFSLITECVTVLSGCQERSIFADAENLMFPIQDDFQAIFQAVPQDKDESYSDLVHEFVEQIIKDIKSQQTVQFGNWCPTRFQISVSYQNTVNTLRTQIAAMIPTDNSAIPYAWGGLNSKFKVFYVKKVFMDWSLDEGFEEEEFDEMNIKYPKLLQYKVFVQKF